MKEPHLLFIFLLNNKPFPSTENTKLYLNFQGNILSNTFTYLFWFYKSIFFYKNIKINTLDICFQNVIYYLLNNIEPTLKLIVIAGIA